MFTLSCFADEISPDFERQLHTLDSLGVRWLSLRSAWDVNVLDFTDEQLCTISTALKTHGIGVSSIGSPLGKTPITDDFDAVMRRTERAIAIAKKLDCRFIRVFSFYMPKDELDKWRNEVIRRLKAMTELAAANDIILLHENEAGIYGESSARCRDLLESVNMPAFRAAYDPSNFVAAGEAPCDESLPNIHSHVAYMHIKDSRHSDGVIVPAGEGDAQLRQLLPKFADKDIFLTLEPHLAIVGRMRGFSGEELFAKAHAALCCILDELQLAYK